MNSKNYRLTIFTCFWGYITQAITVNFPPLLFVVFMKEYGLPLWQVTTLITITFVIQLIIDITLSKILTNNNIRFLVAFGQISAVVGLIGLSILPDMCANKLIGIVICALFYSTGSGIVEVISSPVVENCPTKNKSATMSLLHSFYCWGSAFTILITTIFFFFYGQSNWRIISALWAIVPLTDALLIMIMPIPSFSSDATKNSKELIKSKTFAVMFLMMFLGGAAELAVSQWASTFAETGLKISKSAGDIAGPFLFAILMGSGRVIFTIISKKIRLVNYMMVSAIGLTVGMLLSTFAKHPTLSFIGIAICGLSVAIFWPGTLSLAAGRFGSSASLFGLLAFAGDAGCTIGPLFVGLISQQYSNSISMGFTYSLIFPLGIIASVIILKFRKKLI